MKGIRAALGLDANDSAGRKSIAGIEIVRCDTKLLRGVRIGEGSGEEVVGIDVGSTIEKVIRASGAAPEEDAPVSPGKEFVACWPQAKTVGHSWGQQDERGGVASIKRELLDRPRVDNRTQIRGGRIDHLRCRIDAYDFTRVADLKSQVESGFLGDGKENAGLNVATEAVAFGRDGIVTGRQWSEYKVAAVAADDRLT